MLYQDFYVALYIRVSRRRFVEGMDGKDNGQRVVEVYKKSATYSFIEYGENVPDTADEPEVEGVPDDVINKMILSLPPGYRMVFNLYVFENKSHKEIARMLNIGESSSASQFSRAKALLAKRIKEYKTAHKMIRSWKTMDRRSQKTI